MLFSTIDPLIATGVVVATAATDAVYVMFTSAVVARHRISAATWSSIWYPLSSFAVITTPKIGSMSHSRQPAPGSALSPHSVSCTGRRGPSNRCASRQLLFCLSPQIC
jgi:hypothetical protein